MITSWLLNGLYTIAQGFITLLQSIVPSPPTFWSQATTALGSWWSVVPGPLKWFVPIAPVAVAGVTYFTLQIALGVMALIRRIILAIIP